MVFVHFDRDGGVAAVDGAVVELNGERAVDRPVRLVRIRAGEADPGAAGGVAPFPCAVAEHEVGDWGAGVDDLDGDGGAADDEAGGQNDAGVVAAFGGEQFLGGGPEGGRGRQEERAGETLATVGWGVVVAGGAGEGEAGVAGRHERGERFEEAAGGGLPVEAGGGERHGLQRVGLAPRRGLRHDKTWTQVERS